MTFTEVLKVYKYCSKIIHFLTTENSNLSLENKKVNYGSRESVGDVR